jgi:hypothetical protein
MKQTEPQFVWVRGVGRRHTPAFSVLIAAVVVWSGSVTCPAGTLRLRQCGEFGTIVTAYHKELGRAPGGSASGTSAKKKPPISRTRTQVAQKGSSRTTSPGAGGRASTGRGVPVCRLFDRFGAINGCDYKAHLDNFAFELQNEPSAQGYIIVYNGARRTRRNYAQRLADASTAYLANDRGLDPSRIVTVDGGRRQELTTELWIVPSGATPPNVTPTVEGEE